MPRTPTTREIVDDYGVSHTYTIIAHPAEEGVMLLPTVLRLIGESGGPLVDAIQTVMEEEKSGTEDVQLNGEKLGRAVSNFADEVVRAGGVKFCKDVLKYTTRTDETGTEQKVPVAFGGIYQGNYGELAKALFYVLELNFAPYLRARLEGAGISQTIVSLAQRVG